MRRPGAVTESKKRAAAAIQNKKPAATAKLPAASIRRRIRGKTRSSPMARLKEERVEVKKEMDNSIRAMCLNACAARESAEIKQDPDCMVGATLALGQRWFFEARTFAHRWCNMCSTYVFLLSSVLAEIGPSVDPL
jgi:hypothetical protein